uniref:Uncharacterized protein n=1 Tax=Strigamia maritima TaxID=126957 RepID=T1JI63_STRMM
MFPSGSHDACVSSSAFSLKYGGGQQALEAGARACGLSVTPYQRLENVMNKLKFIFANCVTAICNLMMKSNLSTSSEGKASLWLKTCLLAKCSINSHLFTANQASGYFKVLLALIRFQVSPIQTTRKNVESTNRKPHFKNSIWLLKNASKLADTQRVMNKCILFGTQAQLVICIYSTTDLEIAGAENICCICEKLIRY